MATAQPFQSNGLDVVIVNWNSGTLLRKCIDALATSRNIDSIRIVIVDNASTDDSLKLLGATPSLTIIRNPTNTGFSVACNQGAALSQNPFILFLNPDVEVECDTLEKSLSYLNDVQNGGVGALGIKLLDRNNAVSRSCARWPTAAMLLCRAMFLDRVVPRLVPPHFLLEWDHQETRPVDQVMGAFLMVRRSVFEQLRGFDERFFLYYEDVDLCRRIIDRGYKVMYLGNAVAFHVAGGTTLQVRDRRLWYETRSRVIFADKWHGHAVAMALVFIVAFMELPARVVMMAFGSRKAGWYALRGALMFWRDVPSLIRTLFRLAQNDQIPRSK